MEFHEPLPHPLSVCRKMNRHRLLPWLPSFGALLFVVLYALRSAISSPLGQEISIGESPGFAWIRTYLHIGMGFGLIYIVWICWIQLRHARLLSFGIRWLVPLTAWFQILAVAAMAWLLYFDQSGFLNWVWNALLISLLIQWIITFLSSWPVDFDHPMLTAQHPLRNSGLFFAILFIFSAVIPFLDPSWHRLSDQIVLDTPIEKILRYLFPPFMSGITGVWLAIGMRLVIMGVRRLSIKFDGISDPGTTCFMIFFAVTLLFSGVLLTTLYYAIPWQIENLHLKTTLWHLFFFFSVSGGILFSIVFYAVTQHAPLSRASSLMCTVPLTFGAAVLYPFIRLSAFLHRPEARWVLLLGVTFAACGLFGYAVLFGDLFNPWFTAFSYLKGALLKMIVVAAAGTATLLLQQLLSIKSNRPADWFRPLIVMAFSVVAGFAPFYSLGKYPEVKAAVLQFNDLTRVDAAFARELAQVLGIGEWIHLGQRPGRNSSPHPWPHPWRLQKTHPARLPEDFNLLIIVADALRGDAFRSAGYRRNLTPFLDSWAETDAVSFNRAYSQGGGSFAAFPFLVAGRSRFDLYGPGLYRENLYFKIARTDGIQHYMLMKGFGPRDIYPPNVPVIELTIPRPVSDRRSATADEVFDAAKKAFVSLPHGERFLCFLQLMDVHNDLWKKAGGMDFGDAPRDLYDNNLSYIDRAFSRFVPWLKQAGLYQKTVILFLSDHGEQFWEHGASLHGHTVYEEEIRIPLILFAPGIRNRWVDVPVIAADMAPTIAALAGYAVDPPYDDPRMGISLVPLILENRMQPYRKRDVVGRASFKRRYFLYRNWEWKLVYFAGLDLLQLFNVIQDPSEKNNLLNERPSLAAHMEKDLLKYLSRVEGRTYHSLLDSRLKK